MGAHRGCDLFERPIQTITRRKVGSSPLGAEFKDNKAIFEYDTNDKMKTWGYASGAELRVNQLNLV